MRQLPLPTGSISTAPPVPSVTEVPTTLNGAPDVTITEWPSFSVNATLTSWASAPADSCARDVPP
jgi:hypothetical protein